MEEQSHASVGIFLVHIDHSYDYSYAEKLTTKLTELLYAFSFQLDSYA